MVTDKWPNSCKVHVRTGDDASLCALVSLPSKTAFHPLLLEPEFWLTRLREQRSVRPFLLLVPRPDLSSACCDVEEIRFRAHDGQRLWGMIGRCPLFRQAQPARIRVAPAAHPLSVDTSLVESGYAELVLQAPAGRRLEDRVLDVLRCCDLAYDLEWVDPERVELQVEDPERCPDELRIAQWLRESRLQP